jgi:glycogen debranching enzyme
MLSLDREARSIAFLLLAFLAPFGQPTGETSDRSGLSSLIWNTDSTQPARFISVHGRRAAILGYSETGLEVWAYPVQIVSSYTVGFHPQNSTTGIDGTSILRRIIYSPESVIRIYAGSDFIVREKLFVPLDKPGAIIDYEVDSPRALDIEIRFKPVLDLMWPAGMGGQEIAWNSAISGYVLSEATHKLAASIRSPDIVAHDETPNENRFVRRSPGIGFTMRNYRAGHNTVRLAIALNSPEQDSAKDAEMLAEGTASLENVATKHYLDYLQHGLQIETPDVNTNRAIAWSQIALDQAWVCNPDLGCGIVAGYGPSRKARRPQYDWFFSGDGMVTIRALVATGQYERARQELEFIFKYQDQKTGMIWHELSQSAGWLDWSKYPYMFAHVDLAFDFLNAVGSYYGATDDLGFVKDQWASIQAAYDYCQSLVSAKDGLPRVPVGKEGNREQDPLGEELTLSMSWTEALRNFAILASATNHNAEAQAAVTASHRAENEIVKRYWDKEQHAWITGFTRSGTPVFDRDLGPQHLIERTYVPKVQRDALARQLASSDFQTDWGTRGRASSSGTYRPNSYSGGSVWATGTAGAADTLWETHRPVSALPIWSALVPWSSLDSLGHMNEALAGDYYHEEMESVPEQTWSSAEFVTATVHGLLGLQVDGVSKSVTFAPHLPPNWNSISLRHVRVGDSEIGISMFQSDKEVRLQMQNDGAPVGVIFDPEIPFGAKLLSAHLESQSVIAALELNPQDTHTKVAFGLPHGSKTLTINYTGGVAIIPDPPYLMIGESSKAIKFTDVSLQGRVYTVKFDYVPSEVSGFEIRSQWIIKNIEGATFLSISPGLYRIDVRAAASDRDSHLYQRSSVEVRFATE